MGQVLKSETLARGPVLGLPGELTLKALSKTSNLNFRFLLISDVLRRHGGVSHCFQRVVWRRRFRLPDILAGANRTGSGAFARDFIAHVSLDERSVDADVVVIDGYLAITVVSAYVPLGS